MARTRVLNTISTVERKLKEGRGQGMGQEYLPWLTVYEVPSRGRSTKIRGWKTKREHHLFSDNELRYFFILEWSPRVTDIREQFPLLPVEEVQEIAHSKGINYPVDRKTREPLVMTTDFRITLNDGTEVLRSVKPRDELNSKRTIEKLEIERAFWATKGLDWGIVTEMQIPEEFAENVAWVHKARYLDGIDYMGQEMLFSVERALRRLISQDKTMPLALAANQVDIKLGLDEGLSLFIVKYLIANNFWNVDMYSRVNPGRPLSLLSVNERALSRGVDVS